MMTRYCSLCGTELKKEEEDICNYCKDSFLQKDGIGSGLGSEFE